MVNSINTNIAAYYAQANIAAASQAASNSVARLSSGNRIVHAADDVAALATGTSLATQVTTLKTALTNASQGATLLQIADGALSQITSMLQRQKAIAVQAGSGSLGDSDRAFLDQEFQSLSSEIDRLSSSTTFNGVQLINGALSDTVGVNNNSSNADQSSFSVNFTAAANGNTFIINGVTVTFETTPSAAGHVQVDAGDIAGSVQNLADYLNGIATNTSVEKLSATKTAKLSGYTYSADHGVLTVTSKTGGNLSELFTINSTALGTVTATVSGKGLETIASINGETSATIDADATTTGNFAAGAITYDIGASTVTVYTVQTGDSLRDIVNGVNANTGTTGVTAYITGSAGAYSVNFRTSSTTGGGLGTLGGAGIGTTLGATSATNTVASLGGGGASGIGQGSTIGVGTVGNNILTAQSQQAASSTISFPGSLSPSDLLDKTIIIGGQTFTFTATAQANASQTEILIDSSTDGSALNKTLDNAVAAINHFMGAASTNYQFNQIEARHEGNSIVISNKEAGNALNQAAGALTVVGPTGVGGVSTSAANLSGTSNTGIDTNAVMNSAFVGHISGFNAAYVSANTVNLSITVGGITYSASNVGTNPSADTDVKMISETGGSFTLKLRANNGIAVSGTGSATDFAKALDAAVSPLTFYQKRDVSSYTTSGNLIGSSVQANLSDFGDISMSNIHVTAPSGSNPNGSISFTINGEVYTALTGVGQQLGAYSVTRFVSASDANKYIEFHNGANVLSFDTADHAATLETALKTAFGVGSGAKALSFQVGNSATDTLSVSIGNATTANLFGGQTLDVRTQLDAADASAALETALSTVTSLRANVGALQSRFNFASASIQSSIQNQDAARGELLDTDIASESTSYATSQVKLQAGISVLAQANQSLQALLKLIG